MTSNLVLEVSKKVPHQYFTLNSVFRLVAKLAPPPFLQHPALKKIGKDVRPFVPSPQFK